MKSRRRVWWAALCATVLLLAAVATRADFVTIGNPGNVAANATNTTHGESDAYGYGALPYTYQISRTAVSIAEWEAFYGDGTIGNSTGIGGGTAVGWYDSTYNFWNVGTRSVGPNAPAVYISFNHVAQYVNWLTTGDATQGAYTIDGTTGYVTGIMSRADILATNNLYYLIPTEDEWYKAAYYKPDGSGYSLYAHGLDTVPPQSTDGSNGWNYWNGSYALPFPNRTWTVGSGTEEQNGTFNMMGNVREWNEALADGLNAFQYRGLRGGSYDLYDDEASLRASYRLNGTPTLGYYNIGFRVASIISTTVIPELTTIPAVGETLGFGYVRVGTTSDPLSITAINTGQVDSILSGEFPAAGNAFAPTSTEPFGPLAYGASDSRNYTFTPADRGPDSMPVIVTSDGGNSIITLSGTGVGPVFDSSVHPGEVIDFDLVWVDSVFDVFVDIANATADGNLGDLTGLTLLSAQITGPDDAMFSLIGFTDGTVLSSSDMESIQIRFDTAGAALGVKTASLTLFTDQGAALGGSGDSFTFSLAGTVVVPEPSSLLLLLSAVGWFAFPGRRRR